MIEDFEDTVRLVLFSKAEGNIRKLPALSYKFIEREILKVLPKHDEEG